MQPPFVVIPAPVSDSTPCFEQLLELADAKALIAEFAVETLHAGVLRGLAGLDVSEIDLAIRRVRPTQVDLLDSNYGSTIPFVLDAFAGERAGRTPK